MPHPRGAPARAALLCLLVGLASRNARADDYRRPGLEGAWSGRHLTAPMNSLRIVLGPGQPAWLGQRVNNQIVDGGAQYIRKSAAAGGEDEWRLRAGLGFGLTQDWEVGVLFIPLKFAPELDFENVTVAITRGFRRENWDLGLRFSFQAPSVKAYDLAAWAFNPGVPFVYRAWPFRFDAAITVPIATKDWVVGLNLPLRASINAGPRFFFALESGVVEPRFDVRGDTSVPLSALVGYTELFGSKVLDITATFGWDDFWVPSAPEGRDAVELGRFRVGFGIVSHALVR